MGRLVVGSRGLVKSRGLRLNVGPGNCCGGSVWRSRQPAGKIPGTIEKEDQSDMVPKTVLRATASTRQRYWPSGRLGIEATVPVSPCCARTCCQSPCPDD